MTIIDLIIQLQKVNPNLEVMLDMTKENAEFYHLVTITSVDDIEIRNDKGGYESFLLLSPFQHFHEPSEN